jgi:hypothetical protein
MMWIHAYAQFAQEMSPMPATIAAWAGAVAAVAAALAGIIYLTRKTWASLMFTARVTRAILRLADIGDTHRWPNGSSDLPSAMSAVYEEAKAAKDAAHEARHHLEAYIVAHRADHGLEPWESGSE